MTTNWDGRDGGQARLWAAIERRQAGMLSLSASGLHAQPMLAFVDRRRRRLWFIARKDDDLVREVGDGGCCAFVFQDSELMASISGALHVAEDRRRILRLWNGTVAAWLPEGPHHAGLTLLRMDCVDAEIWVAGVGLTKIAWEMAWRGAPVQVMDLGRRAQTLH